MMHSKTVGMMALAALLLCSACAEKPTSMNLADTGTQQVASIKWDEAVAATTVAKVNNTNLIMMR